MCRFFAHGATIISHGQCASFSRHRSMSDAQPITTRLKRLREATSPRLSIRAVAEALSVPPSSYAFYEDANGYKKTLLPVELTRSLADLFAERGVSREEVLALAGITAHVVPQNEPEQMADLLDAVLIPEIEVGYSMGGGADIDDYQVVQMVPMSRGWLATLTESPASHLFVARGEGDSMMPTLLDRDIVIIDRAQRSMRQQDRIWAIAYAGFSMIKRLRALPDGTLQINSDNKNVSSIQASEGEAFIIGRVVGIVRRI